MQQVAQYIFFFLVGTTVLNFIIAVAARVKTGNREFNVLVSYWMALFLNFAAIAILSKTTNQIALAFFFTAPPTVLMAKMLRDSRNLKTNWPLVATVQGLGMLVSATLLFQTNIGFSFSLIPFIFTISWPWLLPIYDSLVMRRHEANWIEKAMALVFITGIMSHFAFAFYRLDESAAWWGWSQSIAHYQCLSVFLPLLINHRRERNERRNLETALEKLSGNRMNPADGAIDELYHSLELQIGQKEEFSRQLSLTNRNLEEEREMNEILIRTISHDLANPLTVVNAYMEMITSGRIPQDDQTKIQDRMRANLKSALEMIERIRHAVVTRSEADLVKVVPVELQFALQRLEIIFEQKLREKNLKLIISGNRQTFVLADEKALVDHVLSNILSNAVKFSFENSEIHILIHDEPSKVCVEVRDYGVGINPTRYEKSRFISTPGTKGEEGTGFGLIVLGYFVRKFGAELKIIPHAREGERGTSFIVEMKKPVTLEPRVSTAANIFS